MSPLNILPFDPTRATDHDFSALHRHANRIRAELMPDDPPIPREELIAQMTHVPTFETVHFWIAWNPTGDEIVATGSLNHSNTEENTHLAHFDIKVDRDYRQRGLGRAFLRQITETAENAKRRLLVAGASERVPAATTFLERIGATRGLELLTSQLVLSEIDSAQLALWQNDGADRASGFTLSFWDGAYPEESLAEIATLLDLLNNAPRDNLQIEDTHTTPEQIRQYEQAEAAAGRQTWTLFARHTATQKLVGFTEVTWNPNRPLVVGQGLTGVFPEHTGKGIGLWLKATMLDRILRDRPEAQFIRTGNANSNAAMLAINRKLGFRPYISRCLWQVETETVRAYLTT